MQYYVDLFTILALIGITGFTITAFFIKTFGASSLYIANRRLKEAQDQLTWKDNRIHTLETELNNIKHNHYQELEDARRPEQDDGAYAEDH